MDFPPNSPPHLGFSPSKQVPTDALLSRVTRSELRSPFLHEPGNQQATPLGIQMGHYSVTDIPHNLQDLRKSYLSLHTANPIDGLAPLSARKESQDSI